MLMTSIADDDTNLAAWKLNAQSSRRFNEIDPNEYRYRHRYLKPGLGWYGDSSYKVNVMLSSTQIEKFQLSCYS